MKNGTSTKITLKNGVGAEKQPAVKLLEPLHKGTKANKSVWIMQSSMALKTSFRSAIQNESDCATSSNKFGLIKKQSSIFCSPEQFASTHLFLTTQSHSAHSSATNKIVNQAHFLNLDHCTIPSNSPPYRFAVAVILPEVRQSCGLLRITPRQHTPARTLLAARFIHRYTYEEVPHKQLVTQRAYLPTNLPESFRSCRSYSLCLFGAPR